MAEKRKAGVNLAPVLFFYSIGKYTFQYNGGCKGEKPPAVEGGCSAAELTPSGTIGFHSEKKAS